MAPLAGALVYLSQTRDVALGGAALFSLAAGMSVPLLLLGASAGALLPRAGPWMESVKRFFGVLLLGVALWTVQTVLPAALELALWGGLAVFAALLVWLPTRIVRPRSSAGLGWRGPVAAALVVLGVAEWVGAVSGAVDPLQPLAQLGAGASARTGAGGAPRFQAVRSVDELDAALKSVGRAAGHARLLCRLVRLEQGDGTLHLQRPRGAKTARVGLAPESRLDRQHPARPRPAQTLRSSSSARPERSSSTRAARRSPARA